MTIRPELFVHGDPARTLANLLARTDLLRSSTSRRPIVICASSPVNEDVVPDG